MATKLFEDIIFGPIKSRRLGVSLGVNLLPTNGKLCNFNCGYCECGWTHSGGALKFNDKNFVLSELTERLENMRSQGQKLDVITFAGNGEPTMHPDFAEIITRTIALRDELMADAKVAVLSNATMIGRKDVREALAKVDRAILKIDSAIDQTIKILNDPRFDYSLEKVIENMKLFEGELIIQTIMLRGEIGEEYVDNTTQEEIDAYINVLERVQPSSVMLYTIDRDTPSELLEQVSYEEMESVARRIRAMGIECSVAEI